MCRVISVANQKGGVAKSTTTLNLGVGLARQGKKVLLIDADPQGSLTASLGYVEPDDIGTTLATIMMNIINDEEIAEEEGILHHEEQVDLLPANIELSALEVTMSNVMSRELIMKEYIDTMRSRYDYILIDCMPSLGMMTINASGFVSYVINHCGNGWNLGRQTAEGLRNSCTFVSPGDAKPGDLIFFQGTYSTPGASHVGIYVGNNMMIHCGDPIHYSNIGTAYWQQHFMCFGRLP